MNQQIEKLLGHVLIFSEELRSLIQSFELLRLAAEDPGLHKQISRTKRARGFSVIRWNLIQVCVIGIAKLAYDGRPQNPTAARLVEDILTPDADRLRQKLKMDFAVPLKPGLVPSRPSTKEDIAFAEEIERLDVEQLKKDFNQYLLELEKEWKWFEQHREKFKNLRDHRFAHNDVAKLGLTYELKKSPGPEWRVVKEAVKRLIRIAELLLTVLHKKDESFDHFVELARREALSSSRNSAAARAQRPRHSLTGSTGQQALESMLWSRFSNLT